MDSKRQHLQYLLNLSVSTYPISPSLSSHYLRKLYELIEEWDLPMEPNTLLNGCKKCGSIFIFGKNASVRTRSQHRKERSDLPKGQIARMETGWFITCNSCTSTFEFSVGAPARLHKSRAALHASEAADARRTEEASTQQASFDSAKTSKNMKGRQRQKFRSSGLNGVLAKKKEREAQNKSSSSLSLSDFMSTI
ncbi:RNase MRP [Schizosaccharomyces cryophilus OY26]|uniref:RNase MRP n=1 Tax=Schizosaccharomyces cryophilus (strain OY26 / ATCC MYA-4695 / CBS 11777 / NBRC 106824 / NRRL Y48691) TaxID=653667 RepID=S9WYW6_SCHCR|nr:RNase MRP [Schizosaccharomyces cryophilus OY26]EPY49882.1 RNase MRP [Schizosaccharomyces cryophilus OY26]